MAWERACSLRVRRWWSMRAVVIFIQFQVLLTRLCLSARKFSFAVRRSSAAVTIFSRSLAVIRESMTSLPLSRVRYKIWMEARINSPSL